MYRAGIPASITLAQGLLESGAGTSELATEANNHFGIKCHGDWNGPTMGHDDDKPNECFRVYESAEQSFEDHSDFLLRKRYAPLFELDITDYKGWAKGLKKCGYATSPTYAQKLTAIIERYGLYKYDYIDEEMQALDSEFICESMRKTHTINRSSDKYYVISYPGDTYTSLAHELGMDPANLAQFNNAISSDIIPDWKEIFLQ